MFRSENEYEETGSEEEIEEQEAEERDNVNDVLVTDTDKKQNGKRKIKINYTWEMTGWRSLLVN